MKRISFFLTLTLLILTFGLANAEQSVNFGDIDGVFNDGGTDFLISNYDVVIPVRVTNNSGNAECKYNISYGFELTTTDGATWSDLALDFAIWEITVYTPTFSDTSWIVKWFPAYFIEYWGTDGVGYAGVGGATDIAIREGSDTTGWFLTFTSGPSGTICIDQTGDAHPGFEWGWPSLAVDAQVPCVSGNVIPDWGGPYCYELGTPPDFAPEFVDAPVTLSGSHCATLSHDFNAVDPDPGAGPGPDVITYTTDFGSIDLNSGAFTYNGTLGDVGVALVANITATEEDNPSTTTIAVNIEMTNTAPEFETGCGALVIAQTEAEVCADFTALDECTGDPQTFTIEGVVNNSGGTATGAAAFTGGTLCYTPDPTDIGEVVFTVGVTDGVDAGQTCEITFNVSAGAPFSLIIEKTHGTLQGHFADVCVSLGTFVTTLEGNLDLGGFNILVSYDASALTFQGASKGSIMDQCGWEYFTYRYGADGNCGGGCPSGMLRAIGIRETNNGPNHPSETCVIAEGDALFCMSFLVSNDRTLNCSYIPIRFFWVECGDNTLSNLSGTQLYIANTVKDFDYEWAGYSDLGDLYPNATLPTFVGPVGCAVSDKADVLPWIDMFNGGIDIVCSDSIDARGDVNLDGLSNTIADAVMFSNYFVSGLIAFVNVSDTNMYGYVPGYEGSIAASDVNADGLTLTVADLVYMIRIIVGDAQPYPKVNPEAANYFVGNDVISVDSDMGAAFVIVSGDQTPTLLANNMDMDFAYDGVNTRVLVWSQTGEIFNGEFLNVSGDIISIEMATAAGAPVVAEAMPVDFALGQNYPNPFNPTTSISLSLPSASDYTLTIYNVTGQIVEEINGSADAGFHTVQWNASANASGIYFYKLTAGNFTDTKKMVLMK